MIAVQEKILELIQLHDGGVTVGQLAQRIGDSVSRRSLQRHLKALVDANHLIVYGQTHQRVYRLASASNFSDKWLSDVSKNLLAKIQRPVQERPRASYDWDWVQAYEPNQTHWLSDSERSKLHDWNQDQSSLKAGTLFHRVFFRFMVDLSWNSSRLEGNTYSLLDTHRLLELGAMVPDLPPEDAQMILNHRDAIAYLERLADDLTLADWIIKSIHALLSHNLLSDPLGCGRLRQLPVGIAQSSYTPLCIPAQIERGFACVMEKARAIDDPFEQSFFLFVHLPYLQPFDAFNEHTARLACNIPLIQHNLCPISFVGMPKDLYISSVLAVYERQDVGLLKEVWMKAYQHSVRRYARIRQSEGVVHLVGQTYHALIKKIVYRVVAESFTPVQARHEIRQALGSIPEENQAAFQEVVEHELIYLRDYNCIRFGLEPEQWQRWQRVWCQPS